MRIEVRKLKTPRRLQRDAPASFGFHHLAKAIEEIADVVGSGARLRVPLEAERRTIGARQSLEGAVEEGHVRGPEVCPQRRRIYGKTVVLAGDHHLPGIEVFHRMVRAMVAELHLERLRTRRKAHQLVAEADAE